MIPIEIKPKEFSKKMNSLRYDLNFKAAAITMPYKEKVHKLSIPKDRFSLKARSVNLIVKNKFNFFGYNTDVYGAFEKIKKIKKKNKNFNLWIWWHWKSNFFKPFKCIHKI